MTLRTLALAIFCVLASSPLYAENVTAAPNAQQSGPPPRNAVPPLEDTASPAFQARQSWRRTMARKPTPKSGCFSTAFPSTEWTEVPCSNAPPQPHPFRLVTPSAGGTGHGGSPILSVPIAHPITSVSGVLAQVTGVTSESDPSGAGRWSLQLNANLFNSPLCAGQATCSGWEQFIADNPGNVYIQYWLVGHTSPCPAVPAGLTGSWTYYPGAPGQASGCYINGHQSPGPQQGLNGLQGLRVTGSSSSISQSSTYEIANGFLVTATDTGDPLSIGANWNLSRIQHLRLCRRHRDHFQSGHVDRCADRRLRRRRDTAMCGRGSVYGRVEQSELGFALRAI